MKRKLFSLLILLLVVTGCGLTSRTTASVEAPSPTQEVIILTKAPTATNFPRIGTPTPIPPTSTPRPTATPTLSKTRFDDATLANLMAGTISSTGVEATVEIVDSRANGGERIGYITIISEHNIDESDLLLKLFVLEVGSALRTLRAFREGEIDADLDATFITVNNRAGELMGTVKAPTSAIDDFLEGRSSVNQALERLELTGVFETFKE